MPLEQDPQALRIITRALARLDAVLGDVDDRRRAKLAQRQVAGGDADGHAAELPALAQRLNHALLDRHGTLTLDGGLSSLRHTGPLPVPIVPANGVELYYEETGNPARRSAACRDP